MRRLVAAAAAMACAFAAPAAPAQAAEAPGSQALRCVVWSSLVTDGNDDPELVHAIQLVMTYFVGLAEGQTGKKIGDLLTPELIEQEAANMAALEAECLPLMGDFGNRLTELGKALQEYEGPAE